MKTRQVILLWGVCICVLSSCVTTDLDPRKMESNTKTEKPKKVESQNTQDYFVETIEKTVYIDKPIFVPPLQVKAETLSGKTSTDKSLKEGTAIPKEYENALRIYDFDDYLLYPIFTKKGAHTVIMLQPGETPLTEPFLSDTNKERWEIGAGVSKIKGVETQLIFVKPYVIGLETTMTILTDRRNYNIVLYSYADSYMPIVRWNYFDATPQTYIQLKNPDNDSNGTQKVVVENNIATCDPRYLSFNYKIHYSFFTFGFRKPVWLPKNVYDDGKKTYIIMDSQVLQMTMPAVFGLKDEVINYRVIENMIIIDKLIEKSTMNYNGKKITIEKKKGK